MGQTLGTVMIASMLSGGVVNSVIDTVNFKGNCDSVDRLINGSGGLKEMHDFYKNTSEKDKLLLDNPDETGLKQFNQKLKERQTILKNQLEEFKKKHAYDHRREQVILSMSICIIIINFMIKKFVLILN